MQRNAIQANGIHIQFDSRSTFSFLFRFFFCFRLSPLGSGPGRLGSALGSGTGGTQFPAQSRPSRRRGRPPAKPDDDGDDLWPAAAAAAAAPAAAAAAAAAAVTTVVAVTAVAAVVASHLRLNVIP